MSGAVLIMAGGTGGHIFPGLAVAAALRARGDEVHWMGGTYGLEARLVPEAGLPLHALSVRGLRGQHGLMRLLSPFKLVWATLQAVWHLSRLKPRVCVGFGGYPAAPGGVAARLLRVPLIVHEQNAIAGMTNRVLSRWARRAATAFPNALPGAQWVGNPVRQGFEALGLSRVAQGHQCGTSIRVLIVGGSQGARVFNRELPEILAPLIQRYGITVRHQTGAALCDAVQAHYAALGVTAQVEAFIHDMVAAYAQADLVIARSGALTVSELAAAAMPAILVPFPSAVDDHQMRNAQWLVEAGAAILVPEPEISTVAAAVERLILQPEQFTVMSRAARAVATPDAVDQMLTLIDEVAHG
ncbi:MAG: undecaprenyldiphospho-muramoylpentapeptide beta-N-acetylglucosaminyltransferase [Gammaproteobacteria bacterium]|nr:undecaprenyldiphospho-muramoylpentapeptide beta-N-acetylglucosaminyltransferase [Gammaproteobacteria bacterium]